MKRIKDFIIQNQYAVIWTACYAFIIWAILTYLFQFPVFSIAAWDKLLHAHLRGFPGFVFGILILAAIPLYIASTVIIFRNKKPIVDIKIPEFIRRTYAPPPPPAPPALDTAAPILPDPAEETYTMPAHLPTELHGAFIRARMHGERPQLSDIMHAEPALQPVPASAAASADDAMPLPTDFDFDPIPDATPAFTDVPTFSSITFDEPAPDAPATQPDIQPTTTPNNPISEYLTQHNRPAVTEGELIISDNLAIAVHDDPDFWIADDTHWFANGKQRPSPIAALTDAAARGLTPILYMSEQNILDLESNIKKWSDQGILIIHSLDDLPA